MGKRSNALKQGRGKPIVAVPFWNDVAGFRVARNESQGAFWQRFGVTQSCGSKYETDRDMPAPMKMLVIAFGMGRLKEQDIEALRARAVANAVEAQPGVRDEEKRGDARDDQRADSDGANDEEL